LWLDAADLDGDGLQEGWAEGGLDLGGQVRVWADKSGLGRHAVQTDVDNQPLLQLGTQNGLPAIRFDGTGDGLAALGLPTMTGNTNSLFWVQNPTGGRSYMPLHSNNGVNAWALIVNANDGRTDLVGNGNTQTAASYYTDGALAGFTNSASVYTRLNGAAHVVASVNQPFSWNGQMTIANGYSNTSLQGDNTLYWNYAGTMTEILVTSQTLSQADRELVEGYLAWKWGTQAFLPAAHPYKTAAPTLAAATGGTLLGGDGTDTLTGGAGHDSLDGGAGTDTLTGGLGNDTYTIDTLADVLVEAAGGGTDTVVTELSFTLATHFENLTLTGSAAVDGTGNAADNLLTGNDADNLLTGLGGDDTLDGGLGADTLVGGLGDDSYNVDQADDVVVEAANEGFDLIRSAISLTLGDHVEALLLTGTAALDGTGNSLNNSLSGNSAANTLDGGTGGDTLAGGGGDDRYLVDDSLDTVVEVANEGTDLVMASVSHTLSANVEQLVLTGSDDLNGGGNSMANRITGNAGDNTLDGGAAADTLIGGAGDDTYLVDNASDVVTELANEGTDSVRSSASFVLSVNVENLLLTGSSGLSGTGNAGNNLLTGNSGANTLRGNAGDDTLDGGAGTDTLIGGAGHDTYIVAQAGDTTTELAGEGTDTVLASLSWVLADQVENLVLTGAALAGTGNALDNRITGNAAANQLDGDAGADTLTGGASNDTYVVDNLGDVVVEAADEGTDTVLASVTTTLSADVEHLQLTGASAINGIGNALDNTLTGNAAANTLQGGAGNDSLDGGAGADVLVGGSGDDAYTLDNSADVVVELSGEGDDTVRASASFVLGNHVETLVLTGTAAIQGTGNALDNTLVGNSGNNLLDGGAGADTLVGGAGDDTYRVDQAGDVVVEAAGEGSDTVQSAVSYLLGADLEHLTLTGNAAIDGTGNEADNTLLGNGAANALTGADGNDLLDGGAGADTLAGGLGDDHYIVDNAGDSVAEALGEGTDQVDASVSHTLAAFLETLQLTGSADIDGTGNAQANTLTGNSGANVLTGGGGVDSLLGAGGNDTLVLADAAAVAQVDGGSGDDWLQFTAPGLSVDLASLMGRVGNIEGLRLDNGADDLDVQLDALSVASLTDARHELNLRLDNGDTLTIGGTYLEIGRHTDPDGHETVDYALFGSADTTAPPVSTIHVQWLAAGAPA
jgi:Ca2+-binding RTX toxin-like protein